MNLKKQAKRISRILPDSAYIRLQYHSILGEWPNIDNPSSFNEKLQWIKIHDRKPEYTMMADKLRAKEFVAGLIGNEYIVPTYAVWDKVEDIDINILPDTFVIKCNHDSGSVVVCRNKAELDKEKMMNKLNAAMKRNGFWYGREWPYKNIKRQIFAEKYLEDSENKKIRDYKFFCFNCVPKFVYISEGLENHATANIAFYDFEGNELPFHRDDFKQFDIQPKIPQTMSLMVELSSRIAQSVPSPFVRTDFYSVNGKVFFSEITFTPCSGYMPIAPREWDRKIGEWLDLGGKTGKRQLHVPGEKTILHD